MWLDVFNANPYGTNCWLLSGEDTDDAVVVDPGFEPSAVHALLDAAGKTPVAILATHAHADHVGAAGTSPETSPSTSTRPTRWRSRTSPPGTRASIITSSP